MNIVVDIGGTHTRLATANNKELTSEPVLYDTPKNYREGISRLIQEIKKLQGQTQIDAMAIGFAGSLNRENTEVFNSPNLPDWNNKPIIENLNNVFNCKVLLENDTAMVGLGEAHFGAGKGKSIVVYHTLSTGVGGTRVVNGRLDEHALGFEPGHQIIADPEYSHDDADTSTCPSCVMFGHLEGFIGGAAIERKYKKKPTDIKDENIWNDIARYTAYGLNNTLVYWSPDIIVLGGGLIVHDAIKIDKVKVYLERIVKIFPELPPIVKSELGNVGGLYGGIAFIQNNY